MFKPISLVLVALNLSLPAFAQQTAPIGKGAALEAQANALSAAGKTAEASAAYMKAGDAYIAEGNNLAAATDYEKAAALFEKQANAALQQPAPPNPAARPAPPNPAARPAASPKAGASAKTVAPAKAVASPKAVAPAKPLKLKPLAPKAGFVIGRAVYEDGRPIEDFHVMASGEIYGQGDAEGKHGYYELPMQKGLLITHIVARGHLSYRNNPWTLDLQPTQPIAFGSDPWSYNGNADRGIVRDFVLKMAGPQPGYSAQKSVEYSINDDAHSYRYGGELRVSCSYGNVSAMDDSTGLLRMFPDSQIILTLTPTADPRIDGSVSATPIVREFPIALGVNVYGIPIGLYQATARLREPSGTMQDLRLSTAGPYKAGWQDSIKPSVLVEWKKPTYAGSNPDSPILNLVK